jgi:outer membrane protein assembly factor BamB
MPDSVLIDLGEVRMPSAPPPPPPSPPTDTRRLRGLAAVAAVALLAALAGSAPVPAALVEARVPSVIGESMEVAGDRLYVVRPHANQAATGDRTITAYELPSGRRMWRTTVRSVGREYFGMFRMGDTLVLPRYETVGDPEVVGLDFRTGRQVWRRTGSLVGSTIDPPRIMLDTGEPRERFESPDTIEAVDVRTGVTAWTYPVPPGALTRIGWLDWVDGRDRIVTGLRSGRIEVRDARDGRLLAGRDLRPPVTAREAAAGRPWLVVVEGFILLLEDEPDAVTAYALDGLERRWTARLSRDRDWWGSLACGDLLCLQAPDGQTLAVDPETGRIRWQRHWGEVARVGPLLMATGQMGALTATPLTLVDPATGRSVRELGTWNVASQQTAGDPVLYKQGANGRVWFAKIDTIEADVRLLGIAEDVVGDCRAGRDSVVCRRRDSTIGVWRYR